jgi:uncharacterized protein YdhG (YjbR/CyaY superfamily)
MNIIEQKREDIILNNNTAQSRLLTILENTNKSIQKLHIREPLRGDIDLSILKDYGMEYVKHLTLEAGEITNINGLPPGLLSFNCPDNLLISLTDLPIGLEYIQLQHNYLNELDLQGLVQLKDLFVQDNKLYTLENIPPTIKEINCSNNKLPYLNLSGASLLYKLNVSNNPITVIENLPENVAEVIIENTPNIEFRNSTIQVENVHQAGDDAIEKKNYIEGLNEYLKMKTNYEANIHKMKKKIFSDNKSKKRARQLSLSIKPPCIKCKRPVGTIFSKKENRYMAICGDSQNPCKLDIQIFNGDVNNFSFTLDVFKEETDNIKDSIIQQKLDTLFSYVSEDKSVELFKKQLEAYNENSSLLKPLLQKYNDLYFNNHTKEIIDEIRNKIFKLNENIRGILEEYKTTQNIELLKSAVSMQTNELYPEMRKIFSLKNEINEVVARQTDKYEIFQYPILLEKLDHTFSEPPRVVKFNK